MLPAKQLDFIPPQQSPFHLGSCQSRSYLRGKIFHLDKSDLAESCTTLDSRCEVISISGFPVQLREAWQLEGLLLVPNQSISINTDQKFSNYPFTLEGKKI